MTVLYRLLALSAVLFLLQPVAAQPLTQYSADQRARLSTLQQLISQQQAANYTLAVDVANRQGRPLEEAAGKGLTRRLRGIDVATGNLLYDVVDYNARAAATTRTTSLYAGGSIGVSLNGSSDVVKNRLGVWDGGQVYAGHPEFSGRVTQKDVATRTDRENEDVYHATHVSGTMMAAGLNPLVRGMSYGANLQAYDFSNDVAEMTGAAAGLLVSNHSYGSIAGWRFNSSRTTTNKWEWWGDTTLSATQDYKFGLYNEDAQSWDRVANNAPYYLIVKSAGNDHNAGGPSAGTPYYLVQHGNRLSTTPRDPQNGYDQITTYGTAKNILSVGAMSAISNGYNRPQDVNLADFSSWGPTDDGRIKPDIVGVGVNVISTNSSATSAYGALSGTSMSSPNVSGSLLLLQEYYSQLNGGKLMRASTLKGLALHTADEAGTTPGPDYQAGWGLLNIERAARAIQNSDKNYLIDERTLNQGQTYTLQVVASGRGPLVATICWSDPEGAPAPGNSRFNNRTPKLVNDLDARLNDGTTTTQPWTLDPDQPNQPATPGDNIRDNVEQVYIANPIPGRTYTLTINHKGTLTGTKQDYALLLSGVGGTAYCASAPTSSADTKISRVQFAGVNQAGAAGCTTYSDFMSSAPVTDVQPGQPIPLTVTTGTCGASRNAIVKVFADWNGNGNFTDASELLATSGVLNGPGQFVTTITPPSSITAGSLVRLRLVVVETTDPNAVQGCGTYGNGETQDYLLRTIRPTTDVALAVLGTLAGPLCANSQTQTVRVRNTAGSDQSNVPVSLQISTATGTVVASLTSTVPLLRAYRDALVTFTLPTSVVLTTGQAYVFRSRVTLSGDQDTTNNTLTETRVVGNGTETGIFSAAACGSDPSVTLRNAGTGTAFWYDLPTKGTLLAAGNQTTSASRSVYYVATNDFSGRLGPASKSDFGGGTYYGNFGPQPLISTKVPLRIERARIYTGAPGRLTFSVRRFDETVISSATIDVIATRTTPASLTNAGGQQLDDPADQGAVYPLNLAIPDAGDYKIAIDYEDGVTIFRSNSLVSGFPFELKSQSGDVLVSSKGSLFNNATTGVPDTLKTAWYYLYDMQIRPLACAAGQRTAVSVQTRPSPTASISADGSTSFCQGGTVSLRGSATTAVSGEVLSYQWLLNGQAIAGATNLIYNATQSGSYSVQVLGSCSPVSSSAIVVTARPATAPTIAQSGIMLMSSAATGNQWFTAGVPIPGATGPTFTAPQTGRYSVRANVNGCGDALSDEVYIVILATEPANATFRVYPNPVQQRLTVDLDGSSSTMQPTVSLYDARGRQLGQQRMDRWLTGWRATLDVSALPAGTFLVQVVDDPTQPPKVSTILKY
ncbi:S8 family serine peptidase [Fibrella sp. HMF5335]|uniref:S8 family serine peptidase n=1 Tax=Fibrella rubiginis TaxID=2817060 RepID=A0A939K4Y1_9BACT|nr:S8 family serine peptidase [Fibrella rubiginis]MBO0938889.1 S8 family serine peptidase [Fibrella rubiginis]